MDSRSTRMVGTRCHVRLVQSCFPGCAEGLTAHPVIVRRVVMTLTASCVEDTPHPNSLRDSESRGVGFTRNPLIQTIAGSGARMLFSTVDDFLRFAEALRAEKLVSASRLERMAPETSARVAPYSAMP